MDERRIGEAAEAAQVYLTNLRNRPLEAVAEAFGVSRRTASRRCALARELGYLEATTQGRASRY